MGVPKFARYICERYPCLLELLSEYQIPEFDNLYLDMNGIVHCCSHPKDDDAQFRITEEDIFKNIFQYIEILFSMIKPKKLFFMAVDGVAPRAKINQQRGRRFRAAKEAEAVEARALARGEKLPEEAKFDSNCITPGTLFMSRLTEQLKYFVTWKISTNKLWQDCKIVLSGPEVPGEGEHKIMDYIRYARSQPDHDPNTRHCLYGLDADLIMLGLCTHEPHFAVLREEVKYIKNKKSQSLEKTRFCLLHISLLREYLEHEFSAIKDKLNFPFDLEKIIDDWILMGFLIGNDFIPNLPNLHIENGALPILYQAYMEVLPTLDGYINEAGTLKLDRFEKFMERLSQNDTDQFAEHFADLKYFHGKTGRRPNENERTSYRKSKDSPENSGSPYRPANKELSALIKSTDDMLIGHSDEEEPLGVDSSAEMYQMEFMQHKRDYYMNKLEYEDVDAQVLRSQAEAYVTAIQWNLHYYYNGCCSWSWYYPHHYAPYISDIKGFKDLDIRFEKGTPFLPFQQLLAVLPAASRDLLPRAYQTLLTDENSPIIDYYPQDFKTDLNQKKHEWEAIVLIPFIDENRLLDAMEPHNSKLTAEEQKRNSHGPMSIIAYTEDDLGLYEAPQYFPTIQSHAKIQKLNREDIDVPMEKLAKGLLKGVTLNVYFAGFPTFQHIGHSAKLERAKVKVFEQTSRNENMIVSITSNEVPDLLQVASEVLGRMVFVNWPHMREAYVVAVSTIERKITLINRTQGYSLVNTIITHFDSSTASSWKTQCSVVADGYKGRFGIDIGETSVLLHAVPLIGRQYTFTSQGKISLEKTWAEEPTPYAYQAVVTDMSVHDPGYKLFRDITEIYTIKSVVFMLGHPHYGAMGEVIEPGVNVKTGRVKVAMNIVPEPNLNSIKREFEDSEAQWMSTSIAAQRLGLGNHFLSRITGSIYVTQGSAEAPENGKQNVGLNLKFTKRNEEVPGYTKKTSGQWLYSAKSIGLIRNYMRQYPLLFERLAKRVSNDIYLENELFDNGPEKLIDVVNWLKEQPFSSVDTRSCNSLGLNHDTLEKIKKVVDELDETTAKDGTKTVVMQVKPHLLLKPGLHFGNLPPDETAKHRLFDRVINVKESAIVPLGYKGTIVEITHGDDASEIICDIFFDKEFVGGISFSGSTGNRRYKLHAAEFINISHGMRAEQNISSTASGHGQSTTPAKSWRQESANAKKPTQPNFFPFFDTRSNPLPRVPHNNKASNSDNRQQHSKSQPQHHQQQQQQQQQQQSQQIRVMKKNDGHQKRSTNNADEEKKSKPNQVKGKTPKFPSAPEIPETIKLPATATQQRIDLNSEFRMLWNELQKPSLPTNPFNQKPVMGPGIPQHGQILPSSSGDSLKDKSAILKAMLKIPDENSSVSSQSSISSSIAPTVVPNPSKAPPLVQQLFDHARQASRKNTVSYCTSLLTHSQLSGRGMPRYNYVTNPLKLVSAQIVMPDMRTYCGEFCATHVEAAESAAQVVCKELKLESLPKPGMSVLDGKAVMWQNNVHPQLHPNLHPNLHPRPPPMMPSHSPRIFPNMHNPPMHMPRWNVRMQRGAAFPQHQVPTIDQNRTTANSIIPSAPPACQVNSSPENKPDHKNKKTTPFVPLQAQKKTRNPKPKQTSRNQNPTNKDSNQPQSSQFKPRDEPPKVPKDEKFTGNEKKDSESKKTPQVAQKVQRAPKPRRSRIAANFNSTPSADGSGPPK